MLLISASNHVRLFMCIKYIEPLLSFHTHTSRILHHCSPQLMMKLIIQNSDFLIFFSYFYIFRNETFNTNTVVDTALVALKLQFYFIPFYLKFTSPEWGKSEFWNLFTICRCLIICIIISISFNKLKLINEQILNTYFVAIYLWLMPLNVLLVLFKYSFAGDIVVASKWRGRNVRLIQINVLSAFQVNFLIYQKGYCRLISE